MKDKKKLKKIKEILGPEYKEIAVFAAKESDNREDRTISLVDSYSGTLAAMICNYLETNPVATAIVKEVVPHLDSDPLTSAMFNLSFGGNHHQQFI